jgi:cysteinyl-tRNA synthetase
VGRALIARDEESTLPYLLATCEGAFDEVVLVDTGSSDRFADADGIRERLTDAGVEVNDTPAGTEWSV